VNEALTILRNECIAPAERLSIVLDDAYLTLSQLVAFTNWCADQYIQWREMTGERAETTKGNWLHRLGMKMDHAGEYTFAESACDRAQYASLELTENIRRAEVVRVAALSADKDYTQTAAIWHATEALIENLQIQYLIALIEDSESLG